MSSIDDIEGLCTQLRANGATVRRKAIKEVLEIVEKESNRVLLSTMGMGKQSVWVRLVKNAKLAVDIEVANADKKGRLPRNDEADCLWKLVRLADDKSRQLGAVTEKLLTHVGSVLEDDLAREAYGQVYTQILCKILEEPEYCEQISPKLFESTMHTLLRVLRMSQGKWEAREQRGVAAYARGLQLLLSGYGKDIHEFLEPLIDFFSQWCESMDKGCDRGSTSSLKPVSSVFEALKTLLQLYGTACAPMLRADGRGVLDFVLRRFTKAQRTQREYIVEYLRLHLRIAGAAREGCTEVDRDPIFDAVPTLYRLLVNEQEIAGAVGSAAFQQRRRGTAGLWLSLERRGRMHLLLCADLVRFHREEVAGAATGGRDGENHCGGGGGGGGSSTASTQADGWGDAGGKRKPGPSATEASASSSRSGAGGRGARKRARATDPWEDLLATLNPNESSGGRSSGIPSSGSGRRSPTGSTAPAASGGSGVGGGPAGGNGGSTSPLHSLPWLQLLAAILEAYPGGGCWRPQDTAIELSRAVSAADTQLKSTPDQSVHLWALVCLLRAAEASGAQLSRQHGVDTSASPVAAGGRGQGAAATAEALRAAWRSVWATLLRADLRFSNPTGRCDKGGIGEAVVAVLGACMREGLVEPGLVTKEQDRLWALPLFRAPGSASFSTEPFRLVTAFLRHGDLLEGRDTICTQMQMHPGPGAVPPDPSTLAAAAGAESDGGNESGGANDDAPAAIERPDTPSGGRQTRRRWRLLQYLLGWLEGAALEGDGVGSGGGRGSPETEEALAAAAVALVGVTCPRPPAAEDRTTGIAAGRRRPFLIETGDPPCSIIAEPFVAGEEGLIAGGGAAIADGVWGGALDNLGPFLRDYGVEVAAASMRRGWAAATACAVWGFDAAGGSAWGGGGGGGGGDLPVYVDFMAPTLKECEPRLESPTAAASPQLAGLETEASLLSGGIGMPSVGGIHGNAMSGGGGSNMVSRDDTSAMLSLVARWLRGEVAGLARRAADPGMSMVERGRVIRALLHSLGVLAVFFSHACEAGVDHVELESALWASVAASVKALEHAAQAVDYRALCEGLARLNRIVRSLLHRASCSASGQARHQSEQQQNEDGEDSGSASALGEVLRFCSKMVKDWHKGTLRDEPPLIHKTAATERLSYSQPGGGGVRGGSLRGGRGGGGRGAGRFMESLRSRASEELRGDGGGGGGGGGFSDDDDMMDDDGDSFRGGGHGGLTGGGGGGGWEGARGGAGFAASQHSSTHGGAGGAGGGAGGSGRSGRAGEDVRYFGEGKEPGGALKGAMVWCARLSLAVSPHPATARRLSQVFEKGYKDGLVDEAELFTVAREAAEAFFTGQEDGGEEGAENSGGGGSGGGGLSLVASAVDLVVSYADEDDRSSSWLLRLLGVVQQAVVGWGQQGRSLVSGGGDGGVNSGALPNAAAIEAERRCLARLAAVVFKEKLLLAGVKHSRLVRAAHISAARTVFDAFSDDQQVRDRFAALVCRRTTDLDAGVRSAAVGATRVLFRRFLPEKHNAIFATVLDRLPPVVVVNDRVEVELEDEDGEGEEEEGGGRGTMLASEQAYAKLSDGRSENERGYLVVCRREFEATSLVTVADMAASSPRVTRAALYHLVRRSVRPELALAVSRLAGRLALGLGFGSGPALLGEHLMFLMSEWLRERSSLNGFPFDLLGHPGGGRRGDALRACAHVAVPLAVVQLSRKDRLREVQAIAGELGLGATDNGVARLVRLHVSDIKAAYLPLLYTGDRTGGGDPSANPGAGGVGEDRRVATEADGFLQRVIDVAKVGKSSDNLQTLVLRLLDMGAVEPFGVFGRVTLASVADTLEQVAGQLEVGGGAGSSQRSSGGPEVVADAGDLLRRVNFVEVVLHLRGHLARARGAEAQRRVLGMLEFVVTKARVEEDASCLSSTVSVLLWLLEVRASELTAAAAAGIGTGTSGSGSTASSGGVGRASGGRAGGDGAGSGGGAAAVVRLMDGVFGRCMSTSKGRQLLGRYFGAVVEQLVAVYVDLDDAAQRRHRPLFARSSDRSGRSASSLLRQDDGEDSASDDEEDFELNPRQGKQKKQKQRASGDTRRRENRGGGGTSGGRASSGGRSPSPVGTAVLANEEEQECGRVAIVVLGLLRALVVDSPASMSGYVSRLHPFPDEPGSSSPGLRAVSLALATRKELEGVTSAVNAAATTSASEGSATIAKAAAEVWQTAERLVEGTSGEGWASSSSSSSSRTAGSLIANLAHLRAALRRYTTLRGGGRGGGSGGSGGARHAGAWEAMSAGPQGVVLARAAVGAVVRICRSERPPAVHLEATRLAGEIGAVDPYDVELAERASARGGDRWQSGGGGSSSSRETSEDPLSIPKLRALRMLAGYLTDRDADLSFCALCTAKALLSRGPGGGAGATDGLLRACPVEVQAILEPFTGRLARMNTVRTAASVWDGLFGRASSSLTSGAGAFPVAVGGGGAAAPGSALSDEVWTTAGKTFPQWVCGLTSTLLLECYAGVAFRCFRNASKGGGDGEDPTFLPRPQAPTEGLSSQAPAPLRGQDEMLALCYALCRRKAELAACLFPAILYDLVRSHDDPDGAGAGGGGGDGSSNRAAAELSAAFRKHLFRLAGGGAGVNPQAAALGVEALNFLRGRQIAAFLRHHQQGRKNSGSGSRKGKAAAENGGAEEDGSSPSSRWLGWAGEGREKDGGSGLPFGYYLDLDALGVARAAAQCGAQCSALFYAEAWIEGRFGEAAGITASRWRDQGEGSGGDGLDGGGSGQFIEEEMEIWGQVGEPGGGGGREKREVERLLLEVFSSLPEPDSIYGVPAPAADLSAQATVYAHEGGWDNTLPAYDTLLQHQHQHSLLSLPGGGRAAPSAESGGVLDGGGGAGSMVPGIGLQTGIAVSLQRMGLRHVLEHYLRGLRVGQASLRSLPDLDGDLRDMQFESAWRVCEWDPALSAFATNANATTTNSSTHSSSSLSTTAGIISVGYATSAAAMSSAANSHGGRGGGSGRPVFHEHILQALDSLRQRNVAVFSSAVGNARALALARLGSGGGASQEGGKGLYPCLVQLQCVAEMEEAFEVLSSSSSSSSASSTSGGPAAAGRREERDNAVDDAAEVLMERWRARSVPVMEHFESLEPVLALREAMVRVLHHERPGNRSRRLVLRHLLDVSQSARRVGHHSIAQGALHRFLRVSRARGDVTPQGSSGSNGGGSGSSSGSSRRRRNVAGGNHRHRHGHTLLRPEERAAEVMRCRLAEARVSWGKGETDAALRAARAVATRLKGQVGGGGGAEEQRLLSEALRLTGAWVSKTKSESSREILESYLNPAVESALAGGGAALAAAADVRGDDDSDGDSTGDGGWGGESARRLLCSAHFTLAEYLAGLYASVRGRVESPEWRAAGRVADNRARELASCIKKYTEIKRDGRKVLGVDDEFTSLHRYVATLKKEDTLDREERACVEKSVGSFLAGALRNYGKALAASREPDLRAVFAVVSLWFNNQADPTVNEEMEEITCTVPSYKFIPLTYQISSRVGSADDPRFQACVHRLILRLCREHPHHSLLQLLALANGENVSGGGATQFKQNVSTEKIQAARGLLEDLRRTQSPSSSSSSSAAVGGPGPGPAASLSDMPALVAALERLAEAYIDLAMVNTTKFHNKKAGSITFKEAVPKGRLTLDRCLRDRASSGLGAGSRGSRGSGGGIGGNGGRAMPGVVTRPPPVRPDADYRGMPTIAGFQAAFSITDSGIHRPKIVHCDDSAGHRYRQLVKGADDIRQDAVMEQVFATVNTFLREDPAARKRRLKVFTYTIVPLSPDSGVLEWVEDTMPFGSFLTDRGAGRAGAHRRYFPEDWHHSKCRTHLKNAVDKRKGFAEVEDNFHPAFRFFFLENFPEPLAWYNSRLTFTRSAAVSSIVGYVLGIGDRHANNILVHQRTAEVVHIDFGVTFEQGKALSTPETVPFRLTRDVVDGMGVTGTEGAFRRACDAAMRVLRSDAPSVLTILEVLLHDPLYRWMLSPLAARQRQQEEEKAGGGDSGGSGGGGGGRGSAAASAAAVAAASEAVAEEDPGVGGDAAQRALARIKHKLQGYVDPNGDAMSVEGQVKLLINQAKDPENLCRLYPGWAPWL
eukprot:g14899.t1